MAKGRAIGVALASLALVTAAGGEASAAVARGDLIEVVSPRQDGTQRGSARVELRLAAGATGFAASVNRRAVGGRFARRGATRSATLAAGAATGVRYGLNTLRLRARDRRGRLDVHVVRFALVRRDGRLLTVAAPRRASGGARVRLRLLDPRATVTARLNGRPIDRPRGADAGRDARSGEGRLRTLALAADERLRFGRNRLTVTAVDRAGGRVEVERRTLLITRRAPLAGAGRDRRATAGRALRLDGGRSRAAGRPSALRYRWRIVARPRGSRAVLRDAGARRPRLTPDRPGRYRLRLTVSERRAVVPRGRSGSSTDPGSPSATTAAATATASDTTIVDVRPVTPAVGVRLDTLGGAPGIVVGDTTYAPPDPAQALQLLVLDRDTLELVSNASYAGDDAGTAAFRAAVAGLTDDRLVIVATPGLGRAVLLRDAAAVANVNAALRSIGASALPASGQIAQLRASQCSSRHDGDCAGFSAVGIPGLPAGQGTLNPGIGTTASGAAQAVAGGIRGYLQLDRHDRFVFADGDYVAFDTTAPGTTAQQAAIEVGGTTYRSDALPAPLAGVFVLVLDAGTLAHRESETYRIRGGDLDGITAGLNGLAATLKGYATDPSALVFVQSIGRLGEWDLYEGRGDMAAAWQSAGAALQSLGGHAMLWDALSDDTYAQVGPALFGDEHGYPAPFTSVVSPKVTNTPGQLSGLLSRTPNWQFAVASATAAGDVGGDLPLLAYQAPTAWPARDTPGRRAAISCVAARLRLPMPLESSYAGANLAGHWGDRAATMDAISYDRLPALPACDASRFSADDLDAVRDQLDDEFTAVDDVHAMIENFKSPLTTGGAQLAPLRVDAISERIRASVDAPAEQEVEGVDPAEIAEDGFLLLGSIPEVGELTGADFIASMIGLVSDLTTDDSGASTLEYDAAAADDLGATIDEGYQDAAANFDKVFAILVGDWGKLSTAAARAQPGAEWDWSDDEGERAVAAMGLAAQRLAWERLFPLVYGGLVKLVAGEGESDVPGDPRSYVCESYDRHSSLVRMTPFAGASANGVMTPVVVAGPRHEHWILSSPVDLGGGEQMVPWLWSPRFPSDDLTRSMFVTAADGASVPALQPLPFALDVYARMKVLTLRHRTFMTATRGNVANGCFDR